MQRYVDNILSLLEGFNFEKLEADANVVYALSSDFKLIYFNHAWVNFAKENNGQPSVADKFPVGTSIFSAISEPLKSFYTENYQKIFRTQKIGNHDFECSSNKVFRIFHQTVYPLLNQQGLLIINNIVKRGNITHEMEKPLHSLEKAYTWPTGFITQCIHCKRVQRVAEPEVWDWIPEWDDAVPSNNSSSLCSPCFDYYYNQLPMRKRAALNCL